MESSSERRKRLDHERYMRNRSERLAKQHEYYIANRDEILAKKHEKQVRKIKDVGVVVDKVAKQRAYNREWYRKNKSKKYKKDSNGAFPTDYNFLDQKAGYLCGMSVPPVMMSNVAERVWEQWLSKIE